MSLPSSPSSDQVFGRRMRELREQRGISTRDLAERMQALGFQWHHATVQRTETADRPIRLDEALAVAGILRVNLSWLLRESDDVTLRTRHAELSERATRLAQEMTTVETSARMSTEMAARAKEKLGELEREYSAAQDAADAAHRRMSEMRNALDGMYAEIVGIEYELRQSTQIHGDQKPLRSGFDTDIPGASMHRAIMCVDVESGDRRRSNDDQVAVRHGLYAALQHAFSISRIPWEDCYHEDRGDGVLCLIPPEVPKSHLAHPFPQELAAALAAHNQVSNSGARIRVRIALHAGEVRHDVHGVVGSSINHAFRLLEADLVKQVLRNSPAVLALVTSEWFFEEVIRHGPGQVAATYQRVRVAIKNTKMQAWFRVIDPVAGAHEHFDQLTEFAATHPVSTSSVLTMREREIAELIARGLSNKGIADELVISPATVARHVTNILTKLSFGSRGQIAVWAAKHESGSR